MYLGMRYMINWNSERVTRCRKCSKGIKPNGKICKYCNGTGVVTKPNQD